MCNLPGHQVSLYCVLFSCTCEIRTTRNCFSMKLINLVIFTQVQNSDPLNVLSSILLSIVSNSKPMAISRRVAVETRNVFSYFIPLCQNFGPPYQPLPLCDISQKLIMFPLVRRYASTKIDVDCLNTFCAFFFFLFTLTHTETYSKYRSVAIRTSWGLITSFV